MERERLHREELKFALHQAAWQEINNMIPKLLDSLSTRESDKKGNVRSIAIETLETRGSKLLHHGTPSISIDC